MEIHSKVHFLKWLNKLTYTFLLSLRYQSLTKSLKYIIIIIIIALVFIQLSIIHKELLVNIFMASSFGSSQSRHHQSTTQGEKKEKL